MQQPTDLAIFPIFDFLIKIFGLYTTLSILFYYLCTRKTLNEKEVLKLLSIKPKTRPEEIKDYLKKVDLILIMTVEPGFGGQSFMPDCAEKIKYIKENSNDDLIIEVDGGINAQTAKVCKDFGANALVAGSYIYGNSDISAAVNSLR